MRQLPGIAFDLGREPAPDETTVCKFRHLLEKHKLGEALFKAVNQAPCARESSLLDSRGTVWIRGGAVSGSGEESAQTAGDVCVGEPVYGLTPSVDGMSSNMDDHTVDEVSPSTPGNPAKQLDLARG